MPKLKEKEKAIKLRERGFSYNEILKLVPVSKSTLSLWLRSIGLAKRVKQRLTEKRIRGQQKGAQARREQRIRLTEEIKIRARKEIEKISNRDLWMIGTALYWAEGSKEKEYRRGGIMAFSNSEPEMVLLFVKWLKEICLISQSELIYNLYIHETADWKKARKYWSKILSIPTRQIRVYFKRHKLNTKRRNTGKNYHGLIRIRVRSSINLNRKIAGWIEKICTLCHCGVV